MLEIKKIRKVYETEGLKQVALNNVSINFRENEFVSILGSSGSGKTTLLNIIGGLDRYDNGDLIINNVSTKVYKDSDWDSYRNHRIGFVFQSYNLITHQSVLRNVELALTLSGVSKEERIKRATEALKEVGLLEHINKRPNQLSGGQMQRVAIARALVNNPDIVLADEPTGALDSETSKQIMKLLKKIAKDKLVIMVTHNPELANEYSTRIIKLKDGVIIDDTAPYDGKDEPSKMEEKAKSDKTAMNLKTAMSLSLNNLMTKKGRTILTAFAGSIGIIGIALILSLSNGLNSYIKRVEEDTLSSYPLILDKTTVDSNTMLESLMESMNKVNNKKDKVYSNNIMTSMLSSLASGQSINNLKDFKLFIESEKSNLLDYVSDIKYSYNLNLNLYKLTDNGYLQVNPSTVLHNLGMADVSNSQMSMMNNQMTEMNSWFELTGNKELLQTQFDLVEGRLPEKYNEVVLIMDKNNQVSDYALYSLGLLPQVELQEMMQKIMKGEKVEAKESVEYAYNDILGLKYKLVLNTDYYEKNGKVWIDKSNDSKYMMNLLAKSEDIEVVGIIKVSEESSVTSTGGIGYTSELTKYTINKINESEIVKEQKQNPELNVFTGQNFTFLQYNLPNLSKEEYESYVSKYNITSTYEENLSKLGVVDLSDPSAIMLYPKDFESKDYISDIIDDYNDGKKDEDKLTYSDLVGTMMSSVTTIINAISYILMAFVSISLIVSSIMIAVITYISVIERTKEIGILRSIGASKKDVSRVFNAETLIEGLFAGVLGIGITILLNIPINIIIKNITGIANISKLPVTGAIILIIISVLLTLVAGLVPSKMASKKDPVEALRSE